MEFSSGHLNQQKQIPEVLGKKILWTTYILNLLHFLLQRPSKGFVAKPAKKVYSLSQKIFHIHYVPAESKRDFTLVWSSVELGKGDLGVVIYGRQNVSDLMFKKKLLLLITELVVILKYLDQLYDQLCDPQPPPSAKMNNRSFV